MVSRGYNQRNILTHQMLRLTAYSSFYAFRENKEGKEPQDWLPMWFDEEIESRPPDLSDEDVDDLKNLIKEINTL